MNINENIRFPVTDTLHVWGSQEAIAALQSALKARFAAGLALGRAELTEAYSTDPGPEARGETPLPLELAG